jgi:hypothetical protein
LSGGYHDFGANQVLPLLSTLAAPNLERLEMDFNRPFFQPPDWAELDALLCPARFPCLRHIMVVLPACRNDNDDFVAEALPMLEAAGVLCLGYPTWDARVASTASTALLPMTELRRLASSILLGRTPTLPVKP